MYNVKLTFPYPEWNLVRQTPASSGQWGDFAFHINKPVPKCDFWFVFNHLKDPQEITECSPKNVVLLTGEPAQIQLYNQNFLNQFGTLITCQRNIKHPNVHYYHQGHPWFVGAKYEDGRYTEFQKSYDELKETVSVPKTKCISIITSDKLFTDGHKRRYEFSLKLKEHFADHIDLFGRGVRNFSDKWDALAPYKYSVAIENCSCPDWMTEKLYDCFLSHTFPFYHGCLNVTKYFNSKAFCPIDINSFDDSKRAIENILNAPNHYNQHLEFLLKAKNQYLDHYNIFPLISFFIANYLEPTQHGQKITLNNNYMPVPSIFKSARGNVTRIYQSLRSRIQSKL